MDARKATDDLLAALRIYSEDLSSQARKAFFAELESDGATAPLSPRRFTQLAEELWAEAKEPEEDD